MKMSNPEYLAKVMQLSVEEQERLLSRMTGKLPRRLEKDKLSREEALAMQMELEDEQLQEWRERMRAIKASSQESADDQKKSDDKKTAARKSKK